jgi:hypothetical protein
VSREKWTSNRGRHLKSVRGRAGSGVESQLLTIGGGERFDRGMRNEEAGVGGLWIYHLRLMVVSESAFLGVHPSTALRTPSAVASPLRPFASSAVKESCWLKPFVQFFVASCEIKSFSRTDLRRTDGIIWKRFSVVAS